MYTTFYGYLSLELQFKNELQQLFEQDYLQKRVLVECKKNKINNWPVPTDIYGLEAYRYKYLYCYELNLPPSYTRKQALEKAINDLDFFLQIKSELEVREVECLALVRINQNKPIGQMVLKSFESKIDRTNDSLKLVNFPVEALSKEFTQRGWCLPIVFDETKYEENINIHIAFAKYTDDINNVNAELAKYNLVLIPRKYILDVLVLKDHP